jgi:hypothetical protein
MAFTRVSRLIPSASPTSREIIIKLRKALSLNRAISKNSNRIPPITISKGMRVG